MHLDQWTELMPHTEALFASLFEVLHGPNHCTAIGNGACLWTIQKTPLKTTPEHRYDCLTPFHVPVWHTADNMQLQCQAGIYQVYSFNAPSIKLPSHHTNNPPPLNEHFLQCSMMLLKQLDQVWSRMLAEVIAHCQQRRMDRAPMIQHPAIQIELGNLIAESDLGTHTSSEMTLQDLTSHLQCYTKASEKLCQLHGAHALHSGGVRDWHWWLLLFQHSIQAQDAIHHPTCTPMRQDKEQNDAIHH